MRGARRLRNRRRGTMSGTVMPLGQMKVHRCAMVSALRTAARAMQSGGRHRSSVSYQSRDPNRARLRVAGTQVQYQTTMAAVPFAERKRPNVLCLFDVDKTLTPARQLVSPEMLSTLRRLREQVVTGFVGGSDINKIGEQLQRPGEPNCASLLTRPR